MGEVVLYYDGRSYVVTECKENARILGALSRDSAPGVVRFISGDVVVTANLTDNVRWAIEVPKPA